MMASHTHDALAKMLESMAGDLDVSDAHLDILEQAAQKLRAAARAVPTPAGRIPRWAVTLTIEEETAEAALRRVIYADGEVIDAEIVDIHVERIG
jgi:hypothetical protein